MKWAIYIILLVNIGFFVWHFQVTETKSTYQQFLKPTDDSSVRMVMLKEHVEMQKQQSSEPKNWCYSLGPFKQQTVAHNVEAELVQQGFPLKFRVDKDARKKGYWVFLLPAKDNNEARVKVSELKKKHKIKDVFIVTTGEKKHAISLGVYSRFELAYRRQGEIKALGFKAQIKDVKLPTKEYWLDWPREFERELTEEMLEMAKKEDGNISRIQRDCTSN